MFRDVVLELSSVLDDANIGYCLIGESALYAQGVLPNVPEKVEISVQWDAMDRVVDLFGHSEAGSVEKNVEYGRFTTLIKDVQVTFVCYYNTVVATDAYRILTDNADMRVWAKSLYYYLQQPSELTDKNRAIMENYLRRLQSVNAEVNQEAWNQNTYDAWLHRHGTPTEAATKISKNPWSRLHPWSKYLGPIEGKSIMNLLGSHGGKAVALALLGATVSVVDVSEANRKYALDVAREAGVDIHYIVADVLDIPHHELNPRYDVVVMELGVLHYFVDLLPLFQVVFQLLKPGGRFILHEFHPISTKLITSQGKKHKVTGNYFDFTVRTRSVAHSKYGESEEQALVHLREWTIGEIISAVAQSGIRIVWFEEEPNHKIDDIGIPKTFTLVGQK